MTPALRLRQRNRSPRAARSCLQRRCGPRPCTRSALPPARTSRAPPPSTTRSAARRPSATSNTSTVAVAEIVNVTIALQSPTVAVAAGASNEALLFLVANTGNSAETFALAGDSVLVGDDFDPTPAAPFIYFDSDGSGDLSPAGHAVRRRQQRSRCSRPTQASRSSSSTTFRLRLPDGELGRSELRATAAHGHRHAGHGVRGSRQRRRRRRHRHERRRKRPCSANTSSATFRSPP